MSDPLSVAGSAAGIVSLGIQVCQGLVWYFSSVQGRRQDIEGGLGEIQTLASIFYSLNDILPKINQARCTEATMIRQCLKNSEEMLLELNQSLIRLRGPHKPTTNGEKMREKGRMLLHPFQAGKLEALRQSLRGLLGNLNLAMDTTSLEFQATNQDKVDTIDKAIQDLGLESKDTKTGVQDLNTKIQDLGLESKDTNAGVQDLNTRMQENRGRLQSLESTITDLLTQVGRRVSKVEVAVKDLENNITGELTVLGNDVTSIHEGLTGVAGMLSSQSAMISQLGIEISRIQDQGSTLGYPPPELATRGTSKKNSSIRLTSPMCNCKRQARSSWFSFAFWNLEFEFEQEIPGKHHRSCKFFGIDGPTQRRVKAQFPLKLAWLSARMTLASMEYTTGTSNPGCSVRYRNVVPKLDSPVFRLLAETGARILASRSAHETIELLEGTERGILSLYKEGMASPGDRDEGDRCHSAMFLDLLVNHNQWEMDRLGWDAYQWRHMQKRVWGDSSALATALRILQVLDEVVQADDITIHFMNMPFFRPDDNVRAGVQLIGRQGSELVSYLATTQHFDTEGLMSSCIQLGALPVLVSVPDIMTDMELPPMARAIVSRSVIELRKCISDNPSVLTEPVRGYNPVQLCVTWPKGLEVLLKTEARNLIHDEYWWPVSPSRLAIITNQPDSLDLLMEAGCKFELDTDAWSRTTPECVMVVARRLFERRQKVFKFFEKEHTGDITETEAKHLYDKLMKDNSAVPSALKLDHSFITVYHCPWMPFDYCHIFFENGFRNNCTHDDLGLTPVMIWRVQYFSDHPSIDTCPAAFQWLHEGLLDLSPQDPYTLGLNLSSTGRHYLVALSCFQHSEEFSWARAFLPDLLETSARDNCVCWCIPNGKGCSPLGSFLKAFADSDWDDKPWSKYEAILDVLFSQYYEEISSTMTAFVRFITFEALEMTHTCCHFGILGKDSLEFVTKHDGRPDYQRLSKDNAIVILDHEADLISKIRNDKDEKENVVLLDALMEEFSEELEKSEPTLETLEDFLSGCWRRRMAQVFAVDQSVVDEMKKCLRDVKIHLLPERVQPFVWFDDLESEGSCTDSERICDCECHSHDENHFG